MTDWQTWAGHGVIAGMILWLMRALNQHGVKFDVHIWRNGRGEKPN